MLTVCLPLQRLSCFEHCLNGCYGWNPGYPHACGRLWRFLPWGCSSGLVLLELRGGDIARVRGPQYCYLTGRAYDVGSDNTCPDPTQMASVFPVFGDELRDVHLPSPSRTEWLRALSGTSVLVGLQDAPG